MNNFDLRKFIKENREEIVSPFNGAGWNERFFEEMGLLNLIENFKLLGEELKSAKRGDEIGGDTLYDIVGLLEQLSTNLSTITNDIDTVDADQEQKYSVIVKTNLP